MKIIFWIDGRVFKKAGFVGRKRQKTKFKNGKSEKNCKILC